MRPPDRHASPPCRGDHGCCPVLLAPPPPRGLDGARRLAPPPPCCLGNDGGFLGLAAPPPCLGNDGRGAVDLGEGNVLTPLWVPGAVPATCDHVVAADGDVNALEGSMERLESLEAAPTLGLRGCNSSSCLVQGRVGGYHPLALVFKPVNEPPEDEVTALLHGFAVACTNQKRKRVRYLCWKASKFALIWQ